MLYCNTKYKQGKLFDGSQWWYGLCLWSCIMKAQYFSVYIYTDAVWILAPLEFSPFPREVVGPQEPFSLSWTTLESRDILTPSHSLFSLTTAATVSTTILCSILFLVCFDLVAITSASCCCCLFSHLEHVLLSFYNSAVKRQACLFVCIFSYFHFIYLFHSQHFSIFTFCPVRKALAYSQCYYTNSRAFFCAIVIIKYQRSLTE